MAYNTISNRYLEEEMRDLKYFQSKFEAIVEDSREYKQYARRMPSFVNGWDKLSYEMDTQVVPMKSIHLTIDNLDRLIAEQQHMERYREDAERAKWHWEQARIEREIREQNPAVAKAYRNYQMLLELARK